MVLATNQNGYGNIDFYKLGENIAEIRGDFTQEEIAEKIGVSRKTISNWETARKQPRLQDLLSLCDVFQCDLDYMLGKKTFDNKEIEIACNYTGLSKKSVKKLHNASIATDTNPDHINPNYIYEPKINLLLSDLMDNYSNFEEMLLQLENYMIIGALLHYLKRIKNKTFPKRLHLQKYTHDLDIGFMHFMHHAETIKENCFNDDYILKRLKSKPMHRNIVANDK